MTTEVRLSDERGLIKRAQRGERRAFSVLVEHYWTRLYRWLYHLTHDQHTAEDLAQESFLKAFSGLSRFREGNFQAWLFRIAHNSWVNHYRPKQKVRQALPNDLIDDEESPEEATLTREALQLLARAVGRLPRDFRGAFLLRAEEGLSFKEIANVLEITEETARWRVFKARQKLLEVLGPHLQPEES